MMLIAPEADAGVPAGFSTEIDVLIAEARENGRRRRGRRMRVAAIIAACVAPIALSLGVLAGGNAGTAEARYWPLARLQNGTVTGTIAACTGYDLTTKQRVPSQAGLVQVVRGHLWYRRDGNTVRLLPAGWQRKIVASERIGPHQKFSFSVPPGLYVLVGYTFQPRLINSDGTTTVIMTRPYVLRSTGQYSPVSVRAGQTAHAIVGSGCI